MKKILWIGAGGNHKPDENHPACSKNNMFWHFKIDENTLFNYLVNNYDLKYGEPVDFFIKNEHLYLKEESLYNWLLDVDKILFTWNYNSISKINLLNFLYLEKYLLQNFPEKKIINPISKYIMLYKKDVFFNEMVKNGFNMSIPSFETYSNLQKVIKTTLKFPNIVKANNLSGGKLSYLARDKFHLICIYLLMNFIKKLAPLAKLFKKNISFEKIIGIEFFDTFNAEIDLFVTYRILFWGKYAYFLYPHVSKKDWCVHTDMKDDSINKEDYLKAYDIGIKAYLQNKALFEGVKKMVGLDIVVFDFLITGEKIIFLEPELKYGLDKNFIEGQETRFLLDAKFYAKIQSKMNAKLPKMDSIFQ